MWFVAKFFKIATTNNQQPTTNNQQPNSPLDSKGIKTKKPYL